MNQRGRTPFPAVAGSAPPAQPCRTMQPHEARPGAVSRSYTRGWPALRAPPVPGPRLRDPPPPRPGEEPGNGHPPPPAARAHTHPGRTLGTRHAWCASPATQVVRGPWTAAARRLGTEEWGRCRPPKAGSRCGLGAYPTVLPLRLLGALRSGSRRCRHRPSGLGCLRRGWRADPRTPRRRPPRPFRALASRPAPGMRAGRLAVSEAGRGRCRRGRGGRREGGKKGRPSPRAPHRGPGAPGFPALLDRIPISQTGRLRGGAPAHLLRACCGRGALPVRSHSIQPREHPLLLLQRRKLGLREGKPLVQRHAAPV